MDKNQAENLLMKPDTGLIQKVLDSIEKKPRPINLTPKSTEKVINKIIAFEYLVNNYILDENSVEFLRQDNDGVWVSYFSEYTGREYAKVWFTSTNPNLREIFFRKGEN